MKKLSKTAILIITLILLLLLPGQVFATPVWRAGVTEAESWPTLEQVEGKAWIVIDCETGDVLVANNADQRNYPASITKIMTAILTLEADVLDQTVTVSAAAVNLPYGSSKAGFLAGETLRVRDVLAGLMLASGNDAANVLAEKIGGSVAGFAVMMNDKAAALGMTGSHFTNPSGLHEDNHYVTARDMAILSAYAMKNNAFRELVATRVYAMPVTNLHIFSGWAIYTNSNRFLNFGDLYFSSDWITAYEGIKTGSTDKAGNNLVSAALTSTGHELVAVILGVPLDSQAGNPYIYSRTLLEAAAAQTTPTETKPTTIETTATSMTSMPTSTAATTIETGEPIAVLSFDDPWCVAFLILLALTIFLVILLVIVIGRRKRDLS